MLNNLGPEEINALKDSPDAEDKRQLRAAKKESPKAWNDLINYHSNSRRINSGKYFHLDPFWENKISMGLSRLEINDRRREFSRRALLCTQISGLPHLNIGVYVLRANRYKNPQRISLEGVLSEEDRRKLEQECNERSRDISR